MAPVIPNSVVVNIPGAQNEVTIVQVDREDSRPELFSSSPSISPPPSSRPSEPAQTDIFRSPLRIEPAQISLPAPPTELTDISPLPPSTESTEISPLPPVLGWPPTLALNCPDGTPRTAIGSTVGGLVGSAVLVLLVARAFGYTLRFVTRAIVLVKNSMGQPEVDEWELEMEEEAEIQIVGVELEL